MDQCWWTAVSMNPMDLGRPSHRAIRGHCSFRALCGLLCLLSFLCWAFWNLSGKIGHSSTQKKPDWKITGLEDVTGLWNGVRLQGFLFLAEEEEGQGGSGSLKSPTAASWKLTANLKFLANSGSLKSPTAASWKLTANLKSLAWRKCHFMYQVNLEQNGQFNQCQQTFLVQYGSTMWFKSMLACFRKYHVISLVLIDKRPYLPSMSKPDLSLLMMAEIWGSTLAQSPVVPFGHIAGYVKYRDDLHWFSTSMRFFDHLWPKQIGSIQSFKCVVIVLCQSERIRHPSASPFLRREVVGSQNLPDLGWWMSRNMANARWFNGETCSGLHYSRISMCDNVTFRRPSFLGNWLGGLS